MRPASAWSGPLAFSALSAGAPAGLPGIRLLHLFFRLASLQFRSSKEQNDPSPAIRQVTGSSSGRRVQANLRKRQRPYAPQGAEPHSSSEPRRWRVL